MTSLDKIIVSFPAAWALLPVTALLVRYIRQGNFKPLPNRFWMPWGSVLLLSLLALIRNHPMFYHAHIVFVAAASFFWLLVLLWHFWKVRNHVLQTHDMTSTGSGLPGT